MDAIPTKTEERGQLEQALGEAETYPRFAEFEREDGTETVIIARAEVVGVRMVPVGHKLVRAYCVMLGRPGWVDNEHHVHHAWAIDFEDGEEFLKLKGPPGYRTQYVFLYRPGQAPDGASLQQLAGVKRDYMNYLREHPDTDDIWEEQKTRMRVAIREGGLD